MSRPAEKRRTTGDEKRTKTISSPGKRCPGRRSCRDLETLNDFVAEQVTVGQTIKIAANDGAVAETEGKTPNIFMSRSRTS
jgi:hypothetical protein